jgi:HlyD family secretion protein
VVTEIASSSTSVGTTTTSVDQVTNFSVKVRLLSESYNAVKGGAKDLPSPFRPGLSATVDIESETVNELSVPIAAVFTEDKSKNKEESNGPPSPGNNDDAEKQKSKLNDKKVKQFVWLFNDKAKTVKKAEVTTGIQDDKYIVIKSGIKDGQKVVSGPYSSIKDKLKDGMKVEETTKDKLYSSSDKK